VPSATTSAPPSFPDPDAGVRAYLDHASTSPLRPEGVAALTAWLGAADPGRVHTEGRAARVALEDARQHVADLFGTRPRQVIFTSGATESVHAATFGAMERSGGTHLVVPAVEHACVREASARAARVTWTPVDSTGRVDVDAVVDAIEPDTALVHCQLANHEVGTLQPVAEVVTACRERGVTVHVDAAAGAGHVPVRFDELGADLLSVSAHKMGGPRGMGALLVRRGLRFPPLLVGGAQERARRAGLEDVATAVAWGAVAQRVAEVLDVEAVRARAQIEELEQTVARLDGVTRLGPDAHGRLPHLLCLSVAGVEPEAVLLRLDQAGVAAHSGSACATEMLEPSPILAAMGADAERSLRFSVGWSTTDDEVALAARALEPILADLRALQV
jgi:cysteine desulfurase